jgi:hypothetical protein
MAQMKPLSKYLLFHALLCYLYHDRLCRVRRVILDHHVHGHLLALAGAQQAIQPRFLQHSLLQSRRHLLD